jgi:hypothetical protein
LLIFRAFDETDEIIYHVINSIKSAASARVDGFLLGGLHVPEALPRPRIDLDGSRRQLDFGDGLIAEEVGDLWEDWMRHVDKVLEDPPLLKMVYDALPQGSEVANRLRGPDQSVEETTRAESMSLQGALGHQSMGRSGRHRRLPHQHCQSDELAGIRLTSASPCASAGTEPPPDNRWAALRF